MNLLIADSLFIHLDSIPQLQRTFPGLSSIDRTNTFNQSNNSLINLTKINIVLKYFMAKLSISKSTFHSFWCSLRLYLTEFTTGPTHAQSLQLGKDIYPIESNLILVLLLPMDESICPSNTLTYSPNSSNTYHISLFNIISKFLNQPSGMLAIICLSPTFW